MHGENIVGSIAWGSGIRGQMLFASSETVQGTDGIEGFHKAFDTVVMKAAYEFDAPESGDALAISPTSEIDPSTNLFFQSSQQAMRWHWLPLTLQTPFFAFLILVRNARKPPVKSA
jgi:hypothetical protein